MKKVAILGVTGYIGKSLLSEFSKEKKIYRLFLFSRSKSKLNNVVKEVTKGGKYSLHSIDEFNSFDYDVVINCSGIGDPFLLKKYPANIFKATEEMDDLVIDYLIKKPRTLYINFSSGVAYGENFAIKNNKDARSIININDLEVSEYYSIAKINAEAKHRSRSNLNIVDIRVFSFFSRFVNPKVNFLMSEAMDCIKHRKVLVTTEANIVRDYNTPTDLFNLIKLVIKKGKINDFFDLYSKKPVPKFELLNFLKKNYGLKYMVKKTPEISRKSILFPKNFYFAKTKKAKDIGYRPAFTSLQGLKFEIDKMK